MKRQIFLLIFVLIALYNCNKTPTGPVIGSSPIVYAVTDQYPDGNSRIFYIDTDSDSVLDSILIPYQIYGMGISQNGYTLYIGIVGLPFNGLEIDTRTKAITYFGPNTGIPVPYEQLLVNPITSDFFEASTHQLFYKADSLTPWYGPPVGGRHFDTKRKLFYGPLRNSPQKIGVFDYRSFRLVRIIDVVELGAAALGTGNAVVTYDGDKYYYSGFDGYYGYLAGIDLRKNKIVAEYIVNGIGWLGITSLNQDIYRTDAGHYMIFEPPASGLVQIYSPLLEGFKTPIDITKKPNPCDSIVSLGRTDRIVISPDGKKAYLSMYSQFSIMVIDVPTNSIKDVLCGFGFVNSLVVQKN